jgi:cholesterol oxidase
MDQDDPVTPGRKLKQVDPAHSVPGVDVQNARWIDRAKVFQNTAGQVLSTMNLPPDYGTVDSSINDLTPEGLVGGPSNYPNKKPANHCERQGRCIIGCLPGARQTLNKQLMRAMFGSATDATVVPDCPDNLKLQALCEVYRVTPLAAGGYEIKYRQYRNNDPSKFQEDLTVTADRVIFAAGCVGTTELLLNCKLKQRSLPKLSDKLGFGFSTNGDYLAFVENTTDTVNLTRGPVTTSYARFNSDDPAKFHTIEDNGIPRIFSVLFGQGSATLQQFAQQGITTSVLARVLIGELKHLLEQAIGILGGLFQKTTSPTLFQSEDIPSRKIMCFAAIGRDQARGQFRLGEDDDTPLRLSRTDGIRFHEDPIYTEIKKTLDVFGEKLTGVATHQFTLDKGKDTILGVSHPLGGCPMAKDATQGVADEFGRVFGYDGLYVADASLIPSALGVNPSLTISAVALRIAHQIIEDHYS